MISIDPLIVEIVELNYSRISKYPSQNIIRWYISQTIGRYFRSVKFLDWWRRIRFTSLWTTLNREPTERYHEQFARIMGIGRTQEESWTKAAPCAGHVSMRRAHVIMLRPRTYEGTKVIATTVALDRAPLSPTILLHPRLVHRFYSGIRSFRESIILRPNFDNDKGNAMRRLFFAFHASSFFYRTNNSTRSYSTFNSSMSVAS